MPPISQYSEVRNPTAPIIGSMNILARGFIALVKIPIHFLDHITSHRRSQVINSSGLDNIKSESPILIYVHYSKAEKLTDREISTLSHIHKVGFQICLVMNLEKPEIANKVGIEIMDNLAITSSIFRKNVGWDLSAYRDAYFLLKKNGKIGSSPIIFMNNSVIWFPEMIENYFNSLVRKDSDIIAGSISKQYRPHIQTFLFGSLNLGGTVQIELWLKNIKNWRSKRTVVSYGELATNQILKSGNVSESFPNYSLLQESGLKKIHEDYASQTSLVPKDVISRLIRNRTFTQAGIPLNPSHDYWLELIENGFPGLKVDLVRSNPSNLVDYEMAITILLARGLDYKNINELLNVSKSKSLVYTIRTFIKW